MAPLINGTVPRSTKMHSKVVRIHLGMCELVLVNIWPLMSVSMPRSSSVLVPLGTRPLSTSLAPTSTPSSSKVSWQTVLRLVASSPRQLKVRPRSTLSQCHLFLFPHVPTLVENYPGFPAGIMGPELMDKFREQSIRFGTQVITETVSKIDLSARPFRYWREGQEDDDPETTDAIIIATGASAKRLGLKGEDMYWQSGISACAVCDGAVPIFR